MAAAFHVVDPDFAAVVHGAEMEQDVAVQCFFGQGEGALVPEGGDEIGKADAGQFAFRTEGDGDGPLKVFLQLILAVDAAVGKVKGKVPSAVQVQECVPDHLGPGIFRTGD